MEKVEMVRVVMSFLGSLGFGMIFNMKKRHLLAAAAGGMFSWILYCIFCCIHRTVRRTRS